MGQVEVSAPLVIALENAVVSVQRFASMSESAVDQAAQAARGSRLLMEQVQSMERLVRQYVVLDDPVVLSDYDKIRVNFKRTTSELSLLPLDELQLWELNRAIDQEQALYDQLGRRSNTPDERKNAGRRLCRPLRVREQRAERVESPHRSRDRAHARIRRRDAAHAFPRVAGGVPARNRHRCRHSVSHRSADPSARPCDPPARRGGLRRAGPRPGAGRPAVPRRTARLAPAASGGARRAEGAISAPRVARAEDAAHRAARGLGAARRWERGSGDAAAARDRRDTAIK